MGPNEICCVDGLGVEAEGICRASVFDLACGRTHLTYWCVGGRAFSSIVETTPLARLTDPSRRTKTRWIRVQKEGLGSADGEAAAGSGARGYSSAICFSKVAKNLPAILCAATSTRRCPIWAIFPPTLAFAS